MTRAAPTLLACAVALLVGGGTVRLPGAEGPRLDLERFFSIRRIANVQVSPDGKFIACAVTVADLEENRLRRRIWLFGPEGVSRRLTRLPAEAGSPAQKAAG